MGQFLGGGMQPMQDAENPQGPNNPEVTWWCRLLARVVAIFGAAGIEIKNKNKICVCTMYYY